MRSLAIMRETGCPVVFDATHSVQLPGGQGTCVRRPARVRAGAGARRGRGRRRRRVHGNASGPGEGAVATARTPWPLGPHARAARRRWTSSTASSSRRPLLEAIVRRLTHRTPTTPSRMRSMSAIVDIVGREILDSRGNPTVEADVLLESRHDGPRRGALGRLDRLARSDRAARRRHEALPRQGRAARPSSTSTPRSAKPCSGLDASEQAFLDRTLIDLDGTENKSRLGANAMLAVSHGRGQAPPPRNRACRCTATSAASGAMQMPVPMMNVINGGAHANNNLDLQEFMIIPVGAPTLPRGAALRRRGVPRAEEDPRRQGHDAPRSATKAASRPASRTTKRRSS